MKLRSYINNVSALQAFQVMRFSVLILIGIILVKTGYSTDEIGVYELFFFLANVVSFFWVMGLNNGLMSYYPSLTEEKKQLMLFNIAILLLALGFIAGLILYLARHAVFEMVGKVDYLGYLIIYMILSAPANFTEYTYLLKGQSSKIIIYGMVIFALQLILIISGVMLDFSIENLLKLMVGWALFKFVWFAQLIIRKEKLKLDFKLQYVFLIFSLPLIFQMLLGNGMEYVDGFLVNVFYDETAFAQFRYGARELPLVTILVGAVSTALIPVAVNNMADALSEVKQKIKRLMNFLFPISMVLMLISPLVFPMVYSNDYLISAQLFNVYLLVISSRLFMPQVVLFAKHENVTLMISALIELIVNIGLSLLLLKYYGMIGIAWATVIAYLVNKLILLTVAWRKYAIKPSAYIDLKTYAAWLSVLLISYYLSTYYLY
ncbi:oligosaccharide flippase family protein [Portibacter lacus]|uniref:Polysaccharide biosynthesis protein C-terminal domain-containing protein n=1 Tax=Portibacter lacus TaxID=1099794 RepID=A0AA37SQL1_9BACT|nr:polysaccharide biosynthesis C-terminal domain-containing protein [Portibacter lacus]GLR18287.1 hypothetical protein GCM10007940_29030 [Portibacter lacus]